MDLKEFAEKQATSSGQRRRCITCNLDEAILSDIREGRRATPKPVSYPMISKWLESEHGIKIQPNTLRNHFVVGHDD